MIVSDIMSRDVEFIDAEATAQAAAELMGELDVGALPVGSPERLVGIVTDRDILYRVVARGLPSATTRLRDIISHPVIACREEDSLRAAMDLMAANHFRRLPVQDSNDTITGWITMADVSRFLLVGNAALQEALRDVTEAG